MILLLAVPTPLLAGRNAAPRATILTEFNAICAELGEARDQFARGAFDDRDFTDRILDLFVRADSLAGLLNAGSEAARRDLGSFAMQKGVLYLIESLRENYVGVVGRNGVRFVEADQALKAAVAWRSGAPRLVAAP